MLFKWKDGFSCNIEEIDQQHKKLFEIGSRLNSIVSLQDGYDHYDEIMEVLGELKDYTVYHFDYEEALLRKYGYEDLEVHEIEHKMFVEKLMKIYKKDIDGNQQKVTLDVLMFVADWIAAHILKTDMQYTGFLNTKGIH
jgi:hemerythrin